MWEQERTGVWVLNVPLSFPCVCMLSHFSHVPLFATSWTLAHQAPLSMGFPRQEYWSGLTCSPPGDLPNPGIELASPTSPALESRFFTTSATCEAAFPCTRREMALIFSCPCVFLFLIQSPHLIIHCFLSLRLLFPKANSRGLWFFCFLSRVS